MQTGRVRFLGKGEQPILPGWTRLLPTAWREGYTRRRRPYRLEERDSAWEGVLHAAPEQAAEGAWREAAREMLEEMAREGVGIVIPPAEGDFPRDCLPFAEGRELAALFAFAGAAEALRRQGKEPGRAAYLVAGGGAGIWEKAFSSMGNEVNRLGIFTAEKREAEAAAARLYEERGLAVEIFSSPKNPYFGLADVVLSCGMEQGRMGHSLKQGCFWLDLAGNRAELRRLMRIRPDIVAADGFYFRTGGGGAQAEGREAEAWAYACVPEFRRWWAQGGDGGAALGALLAEGYCVSGFSALGRRVKVRKG